MKWSETYLDYRRQLDTDDDEEDPDHIQTSIKAAFDAGELDMTVSAAMVKRCKVAVPRPAVPKIPLWYWKTIMRDVWSTASASQKEEVEKHKNREAPAVADELNADKLHDIVRFVPSYKFSNCY